MSALRGDELKAYVISTILAKTGLSNMNTYGVLRGLSETIYALLNNGYEEVDTLEIQRSIKTATGDYLTLWGIVSGVTRKVATKAKGSFLATAYEAGSISAGAWIAVVGTDLRFKVTSDVSFSTGTFDLPVEAEFAGTNYNIDDTTSLQFTTVVSGLDAVAASSGWIASPGTNDEDDDSLRARIEDRWASIGEGNPPSRYEYIAESISGVAEVKVVRTPRGYGTTDVVIASVDGIPSPELLAEVYSALSDAGLVCYDLQVVAPTVLACPIEIEYVGSSSEAEVAAAIREYALGVSIGGRLSVSKLYTSAIELLFINRVEVLSPDRDVVAGTEEKIIPTVTVRKVSA